MEMEDYILKKTILLFALCIVFMFGMSTSAMAWTLVYANDSNGNATYGNIQTLIDAIGAGKSVRFLWQDPTDPAFGVMDAQVVTVINGIVYAQNSSSVSMYLDGTVMKVLSNPYNDIRTVSTNGDINSSTWNLGSNTPYAANPGGMMKRAIKWFVD
jgi:hypothetical protein